MMMKMIKNQFNYERKKILFLTVNTITIVRNFIMIKDSHHLQFGGQHKYRGIRFVDQV